MSLMALPTKVQIVIARHLAVTLEWPMDDLRSLWVTCSSMCHIYGNPAIGRHVALDQCRHGLGWDNVGNYYALLSSLTQLSTLEACFLSGILMVFEETQRHRPCLDDLTRATVGGHNLVAYMIAILLYRHNGDVLDDDTMRRYMRWVEGEEESRADGSGGPTSRWLRNKRCVLCHREAAAEVI